jgi:hypothetical protein
MYMHVALGQKNDAKRVCHGLKGDLSKLKQQQLQQSQAPPPQQQQQQSPQEVAKSRTPMPFPSSAAAAVAAATAAVAAEHEAVLCHLRGRLSAADALVQASALHYYSLQSAT